MYPRLVENKIKNIIQSNLRYCHLNKVNYYNFIYNTMCLMIIVGVISILLYYKYNSKKNIQNRIQRENEKRDYILYNLRKFQNMNNKEVGTINSY